MSQVLSRKAQLGREVESREGVIRAEIARLGVDHPWAGQYFEGDGLCENVELLLAPDGGCLATWTGCMGLYGANWGKVLVQDGKLRVEFERPNTPGEFACFDSEYTVEGRGEYRFLKPPDRHAVLRLRN